MKKIFKLEFTLEQIVSMIHFQGDEDGATIRATELKPKLDRFFYRYLAYYKKVKYEEISPSIYDEKIMIEAVVKKLGVEASQWLIEEPKYDNDVLKIKNHALNYKVQVITNKSIVVLGENGELRKQIVWKKDKFTKKNTKNGTQGYFGSADFVLKENVLNGKHQKRDYEQVDVHKIGKKFDQIVIRIICFNDSMFKMIKHVFPVYIISNGFGYANGKGYGSFKVTKINGENYKQKPDDLLKYFSTIMNYNLNEKPKVAIYSLNYSGKKSYDELRWLDEISKLNRYIKSGLNIPHQKPYKSPLMKGYFKEENRNQLVNEKKAMKNEAHKVFKELDIKLKTSNPEKDIEHHDVEENAKRVYVRGLLGFAMEYKFMVDGGDDLIYTVKAENDHYEINRFENPIKYRITKHYDKYKVFLIINIQAIKMIQELNPNITFTSNYANVKTVESIMPTEEEFSVIDYFDKYLCIAEEPYLRDRNLQLKAI